jgi:hypothetical protein
MLITNCENEECTEVFVAKSVPPEYAATAIMCGACGRACATPTESDTAPGEDVRARAKEAES